MSQQSSRLHRPRVFALLLIALVAALPLLGARPARAAATFTVNLVGDAADLNPSDNLCDASLGAGPQCTLRAAIQQANATAGRDTVRFNIPGGGLKSIRPASELPTITQSVLIDGYTQPGAKSNTTTTGTNAALRIELDGTNAGGTFVNGLTIDAPNSVVKGLVINRFENGGVLINEPGRGSRIEGCFVGTNAGGTADLGNDGVGIGTFAPNTIIGGTTPAARNLISGNSSSGVVFFVPSVTGTRVEGNLIGTTRTGTGNLGNFIGVSIQSSSGNTIGGDTAAAANVIAFNGLAGVGLLDDIDPTNRNRILRNSIFANDGLGIDFRLDGPTPNDPGDADTGPNNLQNRPLLDQASTTANGTAVSGRLLSTPETRFGIRFFSNPSGGNQGQVFLGQLGVTTDAAGKATFLFLPAQTVPEGQTVTATATDPDGNTSEFSLPKVVT